MTIDDQIRDETLQYDINRVAKIFALSSNKFSKYEYLTGKEILQSNQKQMILQAKFTYSPLGKAFEKQIKTIEDWGEKQIKEIQNQGQVKTIKKHNYDDEDSLLISDVKEIFNQLANKRLDDITKLDEKVNRDDLIYGYKGRTPDEKSDKYDNAYDLINKIENGEIKLADAEKDQINFKSSLGEIKQGSNKKRSKEQKNAQYNIEMLYKARNKAIEFFNDYISVVSEAKNKSKNKTSSKGLKILTAKRLLQD